MTEKQTTDSVQSDNKKTIRDDWFLIYLVGIVNGTEMELPITLNVGGFLVSGLLCSGHSYFKAFSTELISTFDDKEASEAIDKTFSQFSEIYTAAKPEGTEKAPPSYIHLRNTKFFTTNGSPVPGNRGVNWRGKISAVDGFFFGTLNASDGEAH